MPTTRYLEDCRRYGRFADWAQPELENKPMKQILIGAMTKHLADGTKINRLVFRTFSSRKKFS